MRIASPVPASASLSAVITSEVEKVLVKVTCSDGITFAAMLAFLRSARVNCVLYSNNRSHRVCSNVLATALLEFDSIGNGAFSANAETVNEIVDFTFAIPLSSGGTFDFGPDDQYQLDIAFGGSLAGLETYEVFGYQSDVITPAIFQFTNGTLSSDQTEKTFQVASAHTALIPIGAFDRIQLDYSGGTSRTHYPAELDYMARSGDALTYVVTTNAFLPVHARVLGDYYAIPLNSVQELHVVRSSQAVQDIILVNDKVLADPNNTIRRNAANVDTTITDNKVQAASAVN